MSLYTALTQVLAPFASRLNGLLTGYDGTVYSTPGEAVRTQINDLHVLIGDEPGTAINASAIGYGEDSNVADELDELSERLDALGGGVPTTVRQAILTLFNNAYYGATGLTDEKAIIQAWASVVTGVSINVETASISGSGTTQLTASTTPAGNAITWTSSNDAVATVSSNGLVTGVGNGVCTITATSGDCKATCAVTVSGFVNLISISAVYTQSGTVYDFDTLDSLKPNLVVTGSYDNNTSRTLTEYTLSGTLEAGTSTITVTASGKTTTFNVTVTLYVPSGYIRLQYVSVGGGQYIDTNLDETQVKGAEYELSVATGKSGQYQTNGFHILSSAKVYFPFPKGSVVGDASSCDIFMSARFGNEAGTHYTWAYNTVYKVSAYMDDEGSVLINGTEVDNVAAGDVAPVASNKYTIFTYGGNATQTKYRFWGKLYSMKIYGENGLLRNYIPCKNGSNVAGLYDVVNDVFYTSATSTAIVAGEVVS